MRMKQRGPRNRRSEAPLHGGRRNRIARAEAGKRRGKLFDSEELQLLLLSMISEAPRHGYDLIRSIEEQTDGVYKPSPGMVYPILTLLVEMGHAEETETSGTKKMFQATDAGKQAIGEQVERLEQLTARLAGIAQQKGQSNALPIQRAMRNLKGAIGNRLSREGVEEDIVFSVAEMIDETASRIERLK